MLFIRATAVFSDRRLADLARRRQSVGHEQHIARARVVGDHRQGGPQGAIDVGAAAGVDVVDEPRRISPRFGRVALQFRLEALHPVVVGHDVESIAVAQVVEHKLQRLLRLFDLLARHAARSVEHEDHGLRLRFRVGPLHLRAGEQQKEAVLGVARPVAQHGRPDRAFGERVQQPEVGGRHYVALLHLDDRITIARTRDRHLVARAVQRLDRRAALDVDRQREPGDRFRRELLGRERIGELDEIALTATELRVTHRHLAVGAGRDRKDAGAIQPAAHVFE